MKCVDCLPLIEEFFDGEVDDKTGRTVREHLAACAECAEAFDALRAEQELFLRYDRGLEVSTALWQGVRAGIAEVECAEPRTRPRPFLSALREQLAAALAVFAARPALASSMALLAVGVTAGALWRANPQRPSAVSPAEMTEATRATRIADSNGGVRPAPTTDVPAATPETTPAETLVARNTDRHSAAPVAVAPGARDAGLTRRADPPATTRGRATAGHESSGGIVSFVDAGHNVEGAEGAEAEETPRAVTPEVLIEESVAEAAALLDPEDEAVSRHVERAQVLLRSVKNARAAEGEVALAYERELSRKLLEENVTLQIDADADGNKKAKKVLEQLEPYLNDIANLRDRPARGELRSIRERMEKQEIIAALHVYDD